MMDSVRKQNWAMNLDAFKSDIFEDTEILWSSFES